MIGGVLAIMIFYQNLWLMMICGLAGAVLCPNYQKKRLMQKRRQQLRNEFKEALYSLVVSMRAGRSLEGAFSAALEDMDEVMTPYIYQEWKDIVRQLDMGFAVEESLADFGERSGIEEIQSFARTIEVCKRTDGDITRVMENTIQLLQERMEIQMELKVLLAKKKTEQRILSVMPFVVIGLLLLMSPEYLAPLYSCLQGRIVMTVCMGITVLSGFLSKKISSISL